MVNDIPTREEFITLLSSEPEPDMLFALGMVLVIISCAKNGDTLLESIEHFRTILDSKVRGEHALRSRWDQLRQWGG